MPEYGKPIYNDLHWKSTLDFFKESPDAFSDFLDEEYKTMAERDKAARGEAVDAFKRGEPTQEHEPPGPYSQSQAGGSKGNMQEIGPEYAMTPRTKRDDELEAPFNNSVEIDKDIGKKKEPDVRRGTETPPPSTITPKEPRIPDRVTQEDRNPTRKGGDSKGLASMFRGSLEKVSQFSPKEEQELEDDDKVMDSNYPQDPDTANAPQGAAPILDGGFKEEARRANPIEESLLKLMKGDDDQRLNAMSDDKVKKHDEENILVADGDKTGDAMKRIAKLLKYGDIKPDKVGMTRKNALELDKANGVQPLKTPKQSNLPQQAPTMSSVELEIQNRPQDGNQAGVGESIGAITDLMSGRTKQQVWGQKLTENQMKQNPGAKVGGSGDYSLQARQQQQTNN